MDQVLGSEGRALGSRYVLHQLIGDGAASQVFSATVRDSSHAVAVKVLRPEWSTEPAVIARFMQERSILASVNNAHVIRVIDLVVEGNTVGLVMEQVNGEDLRHYLRRNGPLPAAMALRLIDQILQGVIAIHEAGIIHRDIKPENILVDESNGSISLKITDLGIASSYLKPSAADTAVLGTPHYMAPEVIQGRGASPATDMYSVGVVLYEMLTGLPPFADSSRSIVLERKLTDEPSRIDGIPEDLWQLVDLLLAKNPASRPSAIDAETTLSRLESSLADVPALLPPGSVSSKGMASRGMSDDVRQDFQAATTSVTLLDGSASAPMVGSAASPVTRPTSAPASPPAFDPTGKSAWSSTFYGPTRQRSPFRLVTPEPLIVDHPRFPSPSHLINEEEISHRSGTLQRYNFGDHEFLLVDTLNNKLTLNWTTNVTPVEFAELVLEHLSADDSAAKITISVRGVVGDLDAELGATMVIAGSSSLNEECEFFRFDSKYITMALQVLPGAARQSVKVFGVSARILSLHAVFPLIMRTATTEIMAHTVKVGSDSFTVQLSSILEPQKTGAIHEKAGRS